MANDDGLRPGLPERTDPRIRALPLDARGFPVPFFVGLDDKGQPDHRLADPAKFRACIRKRLCWICGGPLGVYDAFVIGPMCGVNRVSSEAPAHRGCAEYAVRACPFLSRPHAHRRDAGLPAGYQEPAGIMLERNPGVAMVWVTKQARLFDATRGGVLFDIGEPVHVAFYAEGREATRDEVEESVRTGIPALLKAAPPESQAEALHFDMAVKRFRALLDAMFADNIGA